ncbi:MAG: hypothetical protein WBG42_08260, partial [Cryomorphaceae bacterium]
GDTYILQTGSGSSTCSGLTVDDFPSGSSGFNGNDRIYLRKNGSDLDYAPNPNHPDAGGSGSEFTGFSQVRSAAVTSPTLTYNSSEWTVSNTENCDDLSVAPFVPNANNIAITSNPSDVSCGTVTFSVSATASTGSIDTYVWRYSAPGDAGWNTVSSLNGTNGLTTSPAGNSSITISGNTAILQDYQFYVDIDASGSPSCVRASNAAQYSYNTRAFYRTAGNGDWNDPTIWEMSDTEGGVYIAACQYPTARNSSKATIQASHMIDLVDFDYELDEVLIEETAQLSLAANSELVINDGNPSGADLIVNGVLEDNGNSANGIDFKDDLSTWEIGALGRLIKTSSSSATRYRDQYEGGIATIPETASWVYRYTGNGDLSFANGNNLIDMYYPNLTLENISGSSYESSINSGNLNFSDFTMFGDDPVIIKGDFNIGGAGTDNINFSNIITDELVIVEGDLIITSGNTLRNTGTDAPTPGMGFEVRGNLLIDGTLDLDEGTLSGQGQLILSGNGLQIGLGDGTTVFVNELEMNAPTGGFFTDFSMVINSEARFLDGIYEINDGATTPADVEFSTNANATGMSNTSFVDGTVLKYGDVDFTFPIGDTDSDGNNFYQPLRMFNLPQTGGYEARYFAEENLNAGAYYDGESNNPLDFQEISNCDYWVFDKISGGDPQIGVNYT